jgi:hypothetical protein
MSAERNQEQPQCDFCGQLIQHYKPEHGKYEKLNGKYFHQGSCILNGRARESKIDLRGC